jgi:carbon storage regulator CsrA
MKMALVLTRRINEKVVLKNRKTAEEIEIIVARIGETSVRLAINADKAEWDIYRNELLDGSRQ